MSMNKKRKNGVFLKNKTKDRLIFALIKLTQGKSLDEITISDLAETAKINRGTFYLSYDDFNDFILSIEHNLLNGFNKKLVHEFIDCGLGEGMKEIFQYIYDNISLFKIFIDDEVFNKRFEQSINEFIKKYNHFTLTLPIEYSRALLLNSTISIIKILILESNPRSVQEITEIFYKTRTMSPVNFVSSNKRKL